MIAELSAKNADLEEQLAERDQQLASVVTEAQASMEETIAAEETNTELLQKVSEVEASLASKQSALDAAHASMEESMRLVRDLQLEKSSIEEMLNEKEVALEAKTHELEAVLNAGPADMSRIHQLEVALAQAVSDKETLLLKLEAMDQRSKDESRTFGNAGRLRRMSLGMDDDTLASALQDEIMQLTSELGKLRDENRTVYMEKENESSKLRLAEKKARDLSAANSKLVEELDILREELAGATLPTSPGSGKMPIKASPFRDISNTPDASAKASAALGLGVTRTKVRSQHSALSSAPVRKRAGTRTSTRTRKTAIGSKLAGLSSSASTASITNTAPVGDDADQKCNQQ